MEAESFGTHNAKTETDIEMYQLPNYFRLKGKLSGVALRVIPEKNSKGSWLRFKFQARALMYGIWMEPWLNFLDGPSMRPLAEAHPKLYLKIQWPYINRSYRATKRLEIIQNHYRFVLAHFSKELYFRLFFTDFLYLAKWSLPKLGTFSLRLYHANTYEQEGEMLLGLYQEESGRLCSLINFSVTAESEISIGCLQGGKPLKNPDEISNKNLTIAFTRHMHGLRPKNLLLFALRHLARAWSINRIRAVSTENQLWKDELKTDYNTFWVEVGGTLGADGMYDLPCSINFKGLQEVKPKKRAAYRRRYQFLEVLGREIESNLATPDRHPSSVRTISTEPIKPNSEATKDYVCDALREMIEPGES